MINILHIIRKPKIGGAENLVKSILNENNNVFFIHYMLYLEDGPILDQINSNKRKYLIKNQNRNKILFVYTLRSILKRNNIHLIHTHQPIDVIYAIFASIGLNIKIVRTYHGYPRFVKASFLHRIKYFIIDNIISRKLSLQIYVSYALQEFYKHNYRQLNNKRCIIYNGINECLTNNVSTSKIREELNISTKVVLLAMIGNFNTESRDHYTICKALKSVIEINPSIHFLFVGRIDSRTSSLFGKCYKFCSTNKLLKNIHFLGERTDISDILNSLDLYIHSSYYETFGLALAEAMAYGVPCISSDIPALREISDNGKNLILFEVGNAIELEKKIIQEINNISSPETRDRVKRAKDFVEKNFTMKTHLNNLHHYYLECLK